jgi:hypothetical protein
MVTRSQPQQPKGDDPAREGSCAAVKREINSLESDQAASKSSDDDDDDDESRWGLDETWLSLP